MVKRSKFSIDAPASCSYQKIQTNQRMAYSRECKIIQAISRTTLSAPPRQKPSQLKCPKKSASESKTLLQERQQQKPRLIRFFIATANRKIGPGILCPHNTTILRQVIQRLTLEIRRIPIQNKNSRTEIPQLH